jgi:hypothetical protein
MHRPRGTGQRRPFERQQRVPDLALVLSNPFGQRSPPRLQLQHAGFKLAQPLLSQLALLPLQHEELLDLAHIGLSLLLGLEAV